MSIEQAVHEVEEADGLDGVVQVALGPARREDGIHMPRQRLDE